MRTLVIDARPATPQIDGLGTYVREVVPRIVRGLERTRVRVLVLPAMESYWRENLEGCEIEVINTRPIWPRQQLDVPLYLLRHHTDVYFYPAHDPPLLVNARLVFSVMDVTQLQVPAFHERHNWLKTTYVRSVLQLAVRRASHVFAISEWTRDSIGRIVGRKYLNRISVTPLAGARMALPSGRPGHLLYVGTDRPHKNLDRLLEAYSLASRYPGGAPPLVIAGGMRRPERLIRLIGDLGIADRVSLRGYLSNAEVDRLYGDAIGLVLVSLGEGFGLPILEAMMNGVPVVTSRDSAMSEVAGDAAVLVDPWDVASIAAGIRAIAHDPELRRGLAQRGRMRAAKFSWEACASMTQAVLQKVLDS